MDERQKLELLQSVMEISEYTDKIDIISWNRDKEDRILVQIYEILDSITGLYLSTNFKKGQKFIKSKKHEDNAEFFQDLFEIGNLYMKFIFLYLYCYLYIYICNSFLFFFLK